jgi:hypothetical protein
LILCYVWRGVLRSWLRFWLTYGTCPVWIWMGHWQSRLCFFVGFSVSIGKCKDNNLTWAMSYPYTFSPILYSLSFNHSTLNSLKCRQRYWVNYKMNWYWIEPSLITYVPVVSTPSFYSRSPCFSSLPRSLLISTKQVLIYLIKASELSVHIILNLILTDNMWYIT